ncbi:putative peptide modification system cyclase [Novilysobacter arseniciresistens]|uniref:putative peptide modification system cyclase n=1 Tax=Novilysobacter arseniciresistens TaxID=1385522 RepID=UPI00068EEF8E|nr:putative peptide modification system cyclase [Lysobacter arseniciresistens]
MNAVETAVARSDAAERSGPQLRTILLTDLVDSTALVERLGDSAAAELFRAHDRLVLGLQQHWRGRLIDRSDGLLLLFERPIDGLGFALDYNRGLLELGNPHGVQLKARAGLHVGEVLTWRNSDEAVRVGAKPVEVEGLAKPMAGRLMAMARPGQILLSAVAEPLAHRAARELGERGQHLLWKPHGRWRFKGVPEPQQIFEVGEAGIAPLRTPPSTPKAWRDVPLWRRPMALAAEVALVAAIAVGMWFVTRPQPAIAFNERDWVMVADLNNLTGDTRYDDALEAALRASLEQSQYVNVVSDTRVMSMIAQMGHDPAKVAVDRDIASEVALRGGIRAVLLPTISDATGPVRVNIEVIDPHTQATVYTESAQGRGASSAITSLDEASQALRVRLGEGLDEIQANSKPLAQVTTGNLDALRAFTLAQSAYARQQLGEAQEHFNQALELDPGFALARIGLARVAYARMDAGTALQHMEEALAEPRRLSDREELYLQAQRLMYRWEPGFVERAVALSNLYPDYHVAAFNASNALRYANRYSEMRDYAGRASATLAVTRPAALFYRAISELALGRPDDAERSFAAAASAGFPDAFVEPALVAAARRDFERAGTMLAGVDGPPQFAIEARILRMTLLAEEGKWAEAGQMADGIVASFGEPESPSQWAARAAALAVHRHTRPTMEIRRHAQALVDAAALGLVKAPGRLRESLSNAALYAGYVAAGAGDQDTARQALALTRPVIDQAPAPVLANMAAIVRAQMDLEFGDPEAARGRIERFGGDPALLLTQMVRARTTRQDDRPATETLSWRARAFGEWSPERPPVLEVLSPPPPPER